MPKGGGAIAYNAKAARRLPGKTINFFITLIL